jgi:tetratricopeptide (TPR) repeat protein
MNCNEVEEREILQAYLLDRLTEPEREEFEKHYFECASCFSQLQTGLAVQAELQRSPVMPARARGASFRLMWAWTPAFVTVALLLAVGIWWYSAQKQQHPQQVSVSPTKASPEVSVPSPPPSSTAPSLEELARVEAPPYSEIMLRGTEEEGQQAFRTAMQNYTKKDYAKSIPGLQSAVKANPRAASFNFYLGACYLLTGQTDPAIASFRKTIALRNPAYSESAHFYLAKAYLKKKEVPAAERELQKAVQLHGSRETEAGEILRQLRK